MNNKETTFDYKGHTIQAQFYASANYLTLLMTGHMEKMAVVKFEEEEERYSVEYNGATISRPRHYVSAWDAITVALQTIHDEHHKRATQLRKTKRQELHNVYIALEKGNLIFKE